MHAAPLKTASPTAPPSGDRLPTTPSVSSSVSTEAAARIVARFTINARSAFARLRDGLDTTTAERQSLFNRGAIFHDGERWCCDPAVVAAFVDARWPRKKREGSN